MSLEEFLPGRETIPLGLLHAAMKSSDLAEMARGCHVLMHHYDRVQPPSDPIPVRHFLIDYYLRCVIEDPLSDQMVDYDDDYRMHSRFEAARNLRSLLESLFDHRYTSLVKVLVKRVTEAFLKGDMPLQNAIETGFLEHVLERPDLVHLFEFWKDNPKSSESYETALKWGLAHPR